MQSESGTIELIECPRCRHHNDSESHQCATCGDILKKIHDGPRGNPLREEVIAARVEAALAQAKLNARGESNEILIERAPRPQPPAVLAIVRWTLIALGLCVVAAGASYGLAFYLLSEALMETALIAAFAAPVTLVVGLFLCGIVKILARIEEGVAGYRHRRMNQVVDRAADRQEHLRKLKTGGAEETAPESIGHSLQNASTGRDMIAPAPHAYAATGAASAHIRHTPMLDSPAALVCTTIGLILGAAGIILVLTFFFTGFSLFFCIPGIVISAAAVWLSYHHGIKTTLPMTALTGNLVGATVAVMILALLYAFAEFGKSPHDKIKGEQRTIMKDVDEVAETLLERKKYF